MDFHFHLKHDPTHYQKENAVVFEYFYRKYTAATKRWLIYTAVFVMLTAVQFSIGQELPAWIFLNGTVMLLLFALWSNYTYTKGKKVFNVRIAEMGEGFKAHPDYEIWFNDKEFGTKTFYHTNVYSWTHNSHVEVFKDSLIVKVYPDSMHLVALTKDSIGEEKFKEVYEAVKTKITALKDEKIV